MPLEYVHVFRKLVKMPEPARILNLCKAMSRDDKRRNVVVKTPGSAADLFCLRSYTYAPSEYCHNIMFVTTECRILGTYIFSLDVHTHTHTSLVCCNPPVFFFFFFFISPRYHPHDVSRRTDDSRDHDDDDYDDDDDDGDEDDYDDVDGGEMFDADGTATRGPRRNG